VEVFRYGYSPSVIRANHGDRLRLTFSTRDTGHSLFLQEYGIDAKVSPGRNLVEVRDPLRPEEPASYVAQVVLRAGLGGFPDFLAAKSRFRSHVYSGPMHGFHQGDLIVRPNWLLASGVGALAALLVIAALLAVGPSPAPGPVRKGHCFSKPDSRLGRALKWRPLQYALTLPMLAVLVVIVMAGLLGTKVGGRNFAVMWTWAVGMGALALVLVPLGGRVWCLACPLPSLGEYLQRGTLIGVRVGDGGRPAYWGGRRLAWPRFLRGPWLRTLAFLGLATFSATLTALPKLTAVVLVCLAGAALLMSLIFRGRAFCSHLCPLGCFVSALSPVGRLSVRPRERKACRGCREKSCLLGGEDGWGCPYGLAVSNLERNEDCGLCTECFKTCPHDNVALAWRRGPWSTRLRSLGEAWQIMVLLVVALAYSLTVHAPWPAMRDLVNLVDKAGWHEFALYAAGLWAAGLVVFPGLWWGACSLGLRLQGQSSPKGAAAAMLRRTAPSLIPLCLALWAVFFVDTIMVNLSFIVLTASDPFGWGWDLLGTAGAPWVQIWPAAVPWLQVALVLAGLGFSLGHGHRVWAEALDERRAALRGFLPSAGLMALLVLGMVIYLGHY
jgi:hypothetical protein